MNASSTCQARLTRRQREALYLRYERGGSISEMADWLRLSRRAVLYRLRNARHRIATAGNAEAIPKSKANARLSEPRKPRMFNASQIADELNGQLLDLDAL